MGERSGRGVRHRLSGRLVPAIGDIVPHRIIEQQRFLRDDSDLLTQGGQADVPRIHAIDQNRSPGRIVEARDEVHQAGFTGAAAPYEC